ncbi:hypothetical protein AB0D14_38410 [Streptomyces sp. NPDC048484]|uniref:hypothetical protein n=1 Tax=Streptomyces sp. NPDC048484 TaxID=3155146 RepID=UPI00343D6B2E
MAVDDWKKAHKKRSLQRLRDEVEQLSIFPWGSVKARGKRKVILSTRFAFWPMMLGEAVDLVAGHPELVIVPEALRHAGVLGNGPLLHKLLAHEMTHLAQYAANGKLWDDQETFFPMRRGVADRAYSFLLEGHAYWADRQITTEIFGAPVTTDETSPDASELWRKLASSPVPKKIKPVLKRSTDAVTQLIGDVGLHVFNEVWTRPDLMPTTAESEQPEIWRRRFEDSPRQASSP